MVTLYPDNEPSVTYKFGASHETKPNNSLALLNQRLDRIEDDIALIKRALIRKGDE